MKHDENFQEKLDFLDNDTQTKVKNFKKSQNAIAGLFLWIGAVAIASIVCSLFFLVLQNLLQCQTGYKITEVFIQILNICAKEEVENQQKKQKQMQLVL
jgi:hypothetical protein